MARLERLREHFAVRREPFANVELTGGQIVAQYSDTELGGIRLLCESFGRSEQGTANAMPARMRADHELGDQRVVARRFIEGLEWNMREDHRETDDRTGELRDEDSSRVVSTARVHVPEICVRHRVAAAESRIELPFCVLQLDHTRATRVVVTVPVRTNCRRKDGDQTQGEGQVRCAMNTMRVAPKAVVEPG